jgi:hypothetical protein
MSYGGILLPRNISYVIVNFMQQQLVTMVYICPPIIRSLGCTRGSWNTTPKRNRGHE